VLLNQVLDKPDSLSARGILAVRTRSTSHPSRWIQAKTQRPIHDAVPLPSEIPSQTFIELGCESPETPVAEAFPNGTWAALTEVRRLAASSLQ